MMFSRIPLPQVEWLEFKPENRRYALCFLPLIGVIIGGLLLLWAYVAELLGVGDILFSVVAVILPILITGGIHTDGFCDVSDAESSFAPREKKLEIMSDPHIGAFAAIGLAVYFLLQFGLFAEIAEALKIRVIAVISCGYVLSRALCGISVVTFKSAKSEGFLQSFKQPADKKTTVIILIIIILLTVTAMFYLSPIHGGFALLAAMISFLYYRNSSYKLFGGTTGDTAGYFIQVCELAVLAAVVLGDIAGVILR
jgi:adenosylcobinamide-GDP ribazoletransferase